MHGKRIDLIHVIADSSAAREKMLQAHKDHQLPLNNNKKKERKKESWSTIERFERHQRGLGLILINY